MRAIFARIICRISTIFLALSGLTSRAAADDQFEPFYVLNCSSLPAESSVHHLSVVQLIPGSPLVVTVEAEPSEPAGSRTIEFQSVTGTFTEEGGKLFFGPYSFSLKLHPDRDIDAEVTEGLNPPQKLDCISEAGPFPVGGVSN
jgi:hypothetical protein